MSDYINYPKIIDDAMHTAVRDVLNLIAKDGLRDDHHFFISFLTQAQGVELSSAVKARYPEEITIVLQYQFEELAVHDKYFSLRLSFEGISEVIVVPYAAITSFADPGAKFCLNFHYYADHISDIGRPQAEEPSKETYTDAIGSSNVIAIDQFRKNNKKP